MCQSHWFNHPHQIAYLPQAKDFWSTPLQGKGADQKPGTQGELQIAQLVEHQTKSFSGPSFESLSGQSLFHLSRYMYNPKFYSMIYQSTCMWPFFFCRTYYLLEQWMELSGGGTSGIPRPPSVTWGVIPWLSGESRSHFQKINHVLTISLLYIPNY